MTETRIGSLNMRWYPETSVLRISETDCFDPALEPTARVVHPVDWIGIQGHSIPVYSVNGHSAEEVASAILRALA